MPTDSKAGNEQSVGKMQIRRGNHGNLPWVTLPLAPVTLRFSVENKYTYLNTSAHHEPRGGWGWGKPKAKRQAKAEQNHEGEGVL